MWRDIGGKINSRQGTNTREGGGSARLEHSQDMTGRWSIAKQLDRDFCLTFDGRLTDYPVQSPFARRVFRFLQMRPTNK